MAIEFLVTAVLSWLSLGLWCAAASVFAVYFCFHSILFFWVDAIVLLKPPHGRLHFAWQFVAPRGAPGQHRWTQPDVVIDLLSWSPPQPDGCSRSSRRIDWLLIVSVHSSIHQSRLLPFFFVWLHPSLTALLDSFDLSDVRVYVGCPSIHGFKRDAWL